MLSRRLLLITLAVLCIVATLPMYLGIAGLSFMAFDDPNAGAKAWGIVGVIVGLCALIPSVSLWGAIRLLHKERERQGLFVSILPAFFLALFWLWLGTQSFS